MSADEVIAYSMGFDARVVNAASVRPYVAGSKLAQEFAHRIDLVERAVADGELKLPTNWPAFVAFARTHRLSLPARLTKALGTSVAAVPHPPNRSTEEAQRLQARVNELEQQLAEPHPRRYRSALMVIRGTAIKKYGHRPGAATSPAPAAMETRPARPRHWQLLLDGGTKGDACASLDHRRAPTSTTCCWIGPHRAGSAHDEG